MHGSEILRVQARIGPNAARSCIAPSGSARAAALLTSLLAFLFVLACASPERSAPPDQPLSIALSAPLGRAVGVSVRNAAELALEEADGRSGEHRVELILLDSELAAEPPLERRRALAAVDDPSVVAYIGPTNSTLAIFSIPVLNRAGLLQISPSVSWPGFTRPGFGPWGPSPYYQAGRRHFFRLIPTDDVQGEAAARWAAEKGFESILVVDHGLVYGHGIASVFAEKAEELGLHVVGHESFDLSSAGGPQSVAAVAELVEETQPALLYFGGGANTGGDDFLCAVRSLRPEQVILVSEAVAAESPDLACDDGSLGGVLALQPTPASHLPSPAAASFLETYGARFGRAPGPYAVNTYEAMHVILAAIEAAEAPTREAVLDAIYAMGEFEGVLGTWRFDARGDVEPQTLALTRREGDEWIFVQAIVPTALE